MYISNIEECHNKIRIWGRWKDQRINDVLAEFGYHPDLKGQKEKAQTLANQFVLNADKTEDALEQHLEAQKRYKVIDTGCSPVVSALTASHPFNAYDKVARKSVAWFQDINQCKDYVKHLNED